MIQVMDTPDRILQLLRDKKVPERQIRKELAATCGITQQAVAQWFDRSTRRISPEFLAKIVARYGSSVDYLITGKRADKAVSAENIELDRLFGLLFARQGEFTPEHYAALQVLVDGLRARAAARFQHPPQDTDKQ